MGQLNEQQQYHGKAITPNRFSACCLFRKDLTQGFVGGTMLNAL